MAAKRRKKKVELPPDQIDFGVEPYPIIMRLGEIPFYDDQVSPTLTKSCFRMSMGDVELPGGVSFAISSGGGCGNFRLDFHLSNGDGRGYNAFVDARDLARFIYPVLLEQAGTKWEDREYAKQWMAEHPEADRDPDGSQELIAEIKARFLAGELSTLEAIKQVREASNMAFARSTVGAWTAERDALAEAPQPAVTPPEPEPEPTDDPTRYRPYSLPSVLAAAVAGTPLPMPGIAPPTPKDEQPKDYELTDVYGPSAKQYAEDDSLLIPQNALVGFKWKDTEGAVHEIVEGRRRHKNGKRVATLKITTYRGISAGAIHYYASINVQVWAKELKKGGYHGAALWVAPRAHMDDNLKIEVRRPILPREKDDWGRPLGKAGEMTGRINSEKEARELAIETFKRRFGPGWVLIDDDIYEHETPGDEPLAETGDV